MNIIQAVTLLHSIAEKGPTPAMYANVNEAFRVIHKVGMAPREIKARLVGPSFQFYDGDQPGHVSYYNFIASIFSQPFGYAGDWILLSKMYDAYDQYYKSHETGINPPRNIPDSIRYCTTRWDEYMLSLPCGMAVYNREDYLIQEIGKLIWAKKVTKVLDIACGNGRLIKKLADLYPHCIFTGIDVEPTAIITANDGRSQNTAFGVMNALKKLPNQQFDLVVSAGLCDYLDDRHFTRLVRRIEYYTLPKYVILGNMKEHNAIPQMDLLRWKLIYRTNIDLISLVVNHFAYSRFRVGHEHLGINLFLHIEPKD